MQLTKSTILQNTAISPELFILDMSFDTPVKAGQFVMIKIPDNSKILPRPISIFDYDEKNKVLSLLIRQRGAGTQILSQLQKGDTVELFGGLGNGFPTDLKNQNILLMGGGEGIAPMLLASKQLSKDNNINVLAGFRYDIESAVLDYFDEDSEYMAQDHDEQCSRGLITDLLDDYDPDVIFCCGPIPMMKAIYHLKPQTKIYVSMEGHMACGVGACMGCTQKDKDGQPLKVCSEGPVFLATEVFNAIS